MRCAPIICGGLWPNTLELFSPLDIRRSQLKSLQRLFVFYNVLLFNAKTSIKYTVILAIFYLCHVLLPMAASHGQSSGPVAANAPQKRGAHRVRFHNFLFPLFIIAPPFGQRRAPLSCGASALRILRCFGALTTSGLSRRTGGPEDCALPSTHIHTHAGTAARNRLERGCVRNINNKRRI